MKYPGLALLLALSLVGASLHGADQVVIKKKNGASLEGEIVREDAAWVEIQTRFGKVRVKRVEILSIEQGVSPLTEFKKRRAQLEPTDADGLLKLAAWCEEQRLAREARDCYFEAREVAGPHYVAAQMRLADLALRAKDYRLAVLTYQDLALRLKLDDAWQALQSAEHKLRRERLSLWNEAQEYDRKGKYPVAINLYHRALDRTVDDEPDSDGDIGRRGIIAAIVQARLKHLESLRTRNLPVDLVGTDLPNYSWVFRPRPDNIRNETYDISIENLRADLELLAGQWLSVSGRFGGTSRCSGSDAVAVRILSEGHDELAVAAYQRPERHRQMLEQRKGDVYLEELLAKYPYGTLATELGALVPGQQVVVYGRLRQREQLLPPFVLEVWALEAVHDPQSLALAEKLKRPLRCQFQQTPVADALEFITLVTGAAVEFETGQAPDLPVDLHVDGRPAGAVLVRIATECGLQWTRRGESVLFKKSLTAEETALRDQVLRLATDGAARPTE